MVSGHVPDRGDRVREPGRPAIQDRSPETGTEAAHRTRLTSIAGYLTPSGWRCQRLGTTAKPGTGGRLAQPRDESAHP